MNPRTEAGPGRRLGELIGTPVEFASGRPAGYVNDVRLHRSADAAGGIRLVTVGLVVGPRRNGSLLGYDRRRDQGPAMVRALVRARHRHAGYVGWTSVRQVDLEGSVVRLAVDRLEDLGNP